MKALGLSVSLFIYSVISVAQDLPRLRDLAPKLKTQSERLQTMYADAIKNLDTQFVKAKDGTVYVSTGDIKAMWLRDSSVQVRPYLMFAKNNEAVRNLIKGVITRQARYISIDPYANAFYEDYRIHERKYELDSLVNPILLAWTYWKVTNDSTLFTDQVWDGFKTALKTMLIEQNHNTQSKYTHHRMRKKNPVAYTGMIWSAYRPSDDECHYNYLIPAQAMAVQALHGLSEIALKVKNDKATAQTATQLENEVARAIERYGIVKTQEGQKVYAFEADGLGKAIIMDDANLPSLLSLPYYGFVDARDPLYQTTRARILSFKNPFYFESDKKVNGRPVIAGIGSEHTPYIKNGVWPLSLITQAETSITQDDFVAALSSLFASSYGSTGLHEAVNANNPSNFSRPDFGWPNAMLVELALTHWAGFKELPIVKRKQ